MTQDIHIILLILAVICNTVSFTQTADCQSPDTFFCNIQGYETFSPFRNTLGHLSKQAAIADIHKYAAFQMHPECHAKLHLFLCSLYFPVCVKNPNPHPLEEPEPIMLPCKETCELARQCEPQLRTANLTWLKEWDCNKFVSEKIDPLCVINNKDKEARPSDVAPSNGFSIQPLDMVHGERCGENLFDCLVRDATSDQKLMCIEKKFICDGNNDCDNSIDELNCPPRNGTKGCLEGQTQCDGNTQCLSWRHICNGILDCTDGTDELDCLDNSTGVMYAIIGVFILSGFILLRRMMIYVKRYFAKLRIKQIRDKEQPSYESATDIHQNPSSPTSQIDVRVLISPLIPNLKSQSPEPSYCDSTYQAASILARSDAYYTARMAGDSGACSVYGYTGRTSSPPPAPPSTPLIYNLDHIYEN